MSSSTESPSIPILPPDPLGEGEVHLWRLPLEMTGDRLSRLVTILSGDETKRGARLLSPLKRSRFLASRALLRMVLAGYLERDPASLVFRYGPQGKPELTPELDLRFNISHSGPLALLGVTRNRLIGVDLEQIRPDLDCPTLARRYFAPPEVEQFLSLPEEKTRDAFFAGWTRKEALLKGYGSGLALPLSSFSVSLTPGTGPVPLRFLSPDIMKPAPWHIESLDIAPGYCAALAIEGKPFRIRIFDRLIV